MSQIEQFTKEVSLPEPIASYVRAVNTGAKEELTASFADDAVVVDVNRELRGLDAITAWAAADIFGAHVHFDVLDVTAPGTNDRQSQDRRNVRPNRITRSSRDEP